MAKHLFELMNDERRNNGVELQRVVGKKHAANNAVHRLSVPPAHAIEAGFSGKIIVHHLIVQRDDDVIKMIDCLHGKILLNAVP